VPAKSVEIETNKSGENRMTGETPDQDLQDREFGATASEDQERVDELEAQGVKVADLPDEPEKHPRAGGKAEPTD
jgi:hypothetical protein